VREVVTEQPAAQPISAEPIASDPPPLADERALALIDGLACVMIAVSGPFLERSLDPLHLAGPQLPLLLLPIALVGPLGAGIYRGRMTGFVSACVTLGATTGAVLGAYLLGAALPVLVTCGLVPLILGPILARLGTRLHRPEEAWRAEARLRPADATPALALKVARWRLPLILRVIFTPIALSLVPLGLMGLVLIRCYQLVLSRALPPQCRFEPSCSRYGFEAFWKLGPVKGLFLTAFRVGRCQPFCTAGHDPVPSVPGGAGGTESPHAKTESSR
jgi:putative membrane protein insertion efficiency factor